METVTNCQSSSESLFTDQNSSKQQPGRVGKINNVTCLEEHYVHAQTVFYFGKINAYTVYKHVQLSVWWWDVHV